MTEQELRTSITPCIMAGNTWFVFEQIKAYADAETKELEEAYAELKSSYEKFYESDAVQHKQILALNAEIKRLRDGAQRARQYCECGNGRGGATKLPNGEWFDEGDGTLYHAVLLALSPAPVTEGNESAYTIQQAKDVFAARYDRTWEDILHQFDIGSGMSKLMDMEQVMEYVAEIYKNEDQE